MKAFITLLLFISSHITLAGNYADYDNFLSQNWELPLGTKEECASHDPDIWIEKAQRMISVDPLLDHDRKKSFSKPGLQSFIQLFGTHPKRPKT